MQKLRVPGGPRKNLVANLNVLLVVALPRVVVLSLVCGRMRAVLGATGWPGDGAHGDDDDDNNNFALLETSAEQCRLFLPALLLLLFS